MSRRLDDLDPRFKPKAMEFLARCVEAGIMVMIIDTLRTPEEHAANVAKGVSWTGRSKHQDGLAMDVCPFETWQLFGPDKLAWSASDTTWLKLGLIAEGLGLRWGGRWTQRDMGHIEFIG